MDTKKSTKWAKPIDKERKTMTREQMMDRVCERWGLEHDYTIDFCTMAESQEYTDSMVLNYYITLMSMSVFDEDDE